MSEVGTVARIVLSLFVPLVLAYITTSNTLPDDSAIKHSHYQWAFVLTGIGAFLAMIEFMRTMRVLDAEKFGRFPKYALVTLNLASAVCVFVGVANLIYLHSEGREQRLQETQRRDREMRERKAEEERLLAACIEQKDKDIDAATKRRNWLNGELKRCIQEFDAQPKGIFSKETAATHCASQKTALDRGERNVGRATSKICTTASIRP